MTEPETNHDVAERLLSHPNMRETSLERSVMAQAAVAQVHATLALVDAVKRLEDVFTHGLTGEGVGDVLVRYLPGQMS